MTGEINDSATASNTFRVILKAIDHDILVDVALVQFGKMTELDEETSDILEAAAKNLQPFVFGHLRKHHRQIAVAGLTLPMSEMKPAPGKGLRSASREGAGQPAKGFQQRVSERVFDEFFQ